MGCSPPSATRCRDQKPVYALEGSIAVTGSLVQWLRDNLGLISSADEIEALARSVEDNGGAYFVPAFSGLFAPHWRPDARGVIVGLTRFVNRGHLARAALEATAFQTREVVEAMNADSGVALSSLKVDGGMVVNELLMQFQADVLGVPVVRPRVAETTALGAAYAAGLAVGFWSSTDEIRDRWRADRQWDPTMAAERARHALRGLVEGGHPNLRLGSVGSAHDLANAQRPGRGDCSPDRGGIRRCMHVGQPGRAGAAPRLVAGRRARPPARTARRRRRRAAATTSADPTVLATAPHPTSRRRHRPAPSGRSRR